MQAALADTEPGLPPSDGWIAQAAAAGDPPPPPSRPAAPDQTSLPVLPVLPSLPGLPGRSASAPAPADRIEGDPAATTGDDQPAPQLDPPSQEVPATGGLRRMMSAKKP